MWILEPLLSLGVSTFQQTTLFYLLKDSGGLPEGFDIRLFDYFTTATQLLNSLMFYNFCLVKRFSFPIFHTSHLNYNFIQIYPNLLPLF